MTTEAYWEHFAHDADIGVRGIAPTLPDAFAQAAQALTAVITDPQRVAAHQTITLDCAAPDFELLFWSWLNALIYQMAVRRMLFSRCDVAIAGEHLHATAWGEDLDPGKHQPAVEIKGATFTGLRVERLADGRWLAQCVVDV